MKKTHRVFEISRGGGKHKVNLTLALVGEDVVAIVCGGEKPHVGAISVAIPRPSLRDPKKLSCTSSVFTLIGHKDDEVARPASEEFARELNRVAVVSAGIHVEKASEEDIQKLMRNAKNAVRDAIRILKSKH